MSVCFKELGLKKFRTVLFVFVLSSFLPVLRPLFHQGKDIPLPARQPRNFGNYAELSPLKFITRPA